MNQRLASALADLERLSAERQLDAAALIEAFVAQDATRPAWTPAQLDEIRAGVAEAEQGKFVSDEELAALFARFKK